MSATVVESLSKLLDAKGSAWAEVEDAVEAVLRVACDNGVNGRALGVMPRDSRWEGKGIVDLEMDDHEGASAMRGLQEVVSGTMHRSLPAGQQ